jgi:spermidine synthase
MGYTLRASLDSLPEEAEVVVAEVFPEVVAWCRGPLAELASAPLDDSRVRVEALDVWAVLEADSACFDAILLDVDNGPQALTLSSNQRLYEGRGLDLLADRLRTGGVLGVWSADPDPGFERRLRQAGFEVEAHQVAAHTGRDDPRHTIFVATRHTTAEDRL